MIPEIRYATDRWINGRMNGQTDGWMDRKIDIQIWVPDLKMVPVTFFTMPVIE